MFNRSHLVILLLLGLAGLSFAQTNDPNSIHQAGEVPTPGSSAIPEDTGADQAEEAVAEQEGSDEANSGNTQNPEDTDADASAGAADDQDKDAEEQKANLKKVSDEQLAQYFELCDKLFEKYVDEDGDVDYALLRRKRLDLIETHRQLTKISTAEYMSYSRDEKIAFWINTHNLLTLKLVVDNHPIQPRWYMLIYPDNSIMQIPGGRDKTLFEVWQERTEHTLREIEERLLGKFDDLRICFALSYASKGSAFLRQEAYWPARLDQQLDEQVKRFVESDRGVQIHQNRDLVELSDVFNRYRDEFAQSKYADIKRFRDRSDFVRACLNFILEYVSEDEVRFLLDKSFDVKFMIYDWHLNEQPEKK